MKKLFVFILLTLFSLSASAQFFKKFDNFWSKRFNRVVYDTNYISRPQNAKWGLRFSIPFTWSTLSTSGSYNGTDFSTKTSSDITPKVKIAASYYGLTIGFGINTKKIFAKDERDIELRINAYGKRMGFQLELHQVQTLEGTLKIEDVDITIPKEFVTYGHYYFDFYYVFNNKHFSHPAAFNQSFIQKRSAGSILGGLSFNIMTLDVGDSIQQTDIFRVQSVTLGLGVGYGYNFVLPHRWLVHISALPYLAISGRNSFRISEIDENGDEVYIETLNSTGFPEAFVIGKFSAVRWLNERWYAGLMVLFDYSNIKATYTAVYTKNWQASAYVGIRW